MYLTPLFLSPLPVTIICVGLVALALGIFGIWKTPSLKGKIGILLSILFLLVFCSCGIIFLINSGKQELQEALFQAALNGNTAKVKELVSKGADINHINTDGTTLLYYAVEAGNYQMFKALVEAGVDVHKLSGGNVREARDMLQFVLERSCNPWLKREKFDYDAAVKLLIEHGAKFDFNAKDGWHRTCLQNAIENSQSEILKLMFENGADINIRNDDGGVLHWAISDRSPTSIFELLLTYNPDINAKNSLGYTPLHKAVFHTRKDIVLILMGKGADLNAKNNQNMTALELAKSMQKSRLGNRQEIIDLLEQKQFNHSRQGSDANSVQGNKNESK